MNMLATALCCTFLVSDLDELAAALAQQRDQIRTLQCEFELNQHGVVTKCRFAMSGQIMRASLADPTSTGEFWTDGAIQRRHINLMGSFHAKVSECDGYFLQCDARMWALLAVRSAVYDPQGVHALFFKGAVWADMLPPKTKLKSFRRDPASGLAMLVVSDERDSHTWTVEFDEKRNFLPRRLVLDLIKPPFDSEHIELIVEESAEVAPGIWFPTKVIQRARVGALDLTDPKTGAMRTIVFTKVSINEPVPEQALAFSFPPGAIVSDTIQEQVFRVDAEGRASEPLFDDEGKPMRVKSGRASGAHLRPAATALPALPQGAPQFVKQTASLPPAAFPWGWVLAGCAAILLVGAAWLWRRRRGVTT